MRLQTDFQVFLGIDQTGAVLSGSRGLRARPLHWAALHVDRDRGAPRLEIPEKRLERLQLDLLESTLGLPRRTRVAVLLDCVLGLPSQVPSWKQALERLQKESGEFGRGPAERFFAGLLGERDALPTRLCEEWAKANSVFRARPYQKNIQTGTFRLWRDLASDPRLAEWSIWPFSREPGKFTLFEGYPSLMWRSVAGLGPRRPKSLARWLRANGIRFTRADERAFSKDADLADSVMLAAAGWILSNENRLLEPFRGFFRSKAFLDRARVEGWIAGLSGPTKR